MKMMDAEREVLQLCPDSTVFFDYKRAHFCYEKAGYIFPRGFEIHCCIYVVSHQLLIEASNWELAVKKLRSQLKVELPQPCPDQEALPMPA